MSLHLRSDGSPVGGCEMRVRCSGVVCQDCSEPPSLASQPEGVVCSEQQPHPTSQDAPDEQKVHLAECRLPLNQRSFPFRCATD